MQNNIVAVVVTYNRKALLKECIESLLAQEKIKCDILIVDNASTDGTNILVKSYIETNTFNGKGRADVSILYYNTGENLGGAGGFQYGIRQAVLMNYEYIWIMDDDCIPKQTALYELINVDKKINGKFGFLSSKVLWKDGSLCNMNVQKKTLLRKVTDFSPGLKSITLASFVSLFIKSEVIREIGLPIKEFFIWTDDWEYTRRISKKYPCYLVTESEVIHKSESNISADISTDTENRLSRYWYLYRNDVYLYRREGMLGFLYELCRIPYLIFKVLIKARSNKMKRVKNILFGTYAGLKFNPQIEYVKKLSKT